MMKTSLGQAPTEFVIGASWALLGVVLGVAAAFGLWSQLQHTMEPGILTSAVAALAAGLVFIALAVRTTGVRLFMLAAGLALALAFFAGAGAFGALLS
jgi:hypothetical protein